MTTAADVERLKGQVRDLERILVREGATEAAYERQLAEAIRERDEALAEASRLDDEAIYQRGLYESARAEVERLQRELTESEVARERDEARAALAGAENSLAAEREHSARLSRECQERHDELRAEVERLRAWNSLHDRNVDCSSSPTPCIVQAPCKRHLWETEMYARCRTVAERQREACAARLERPITFWDITTPAAEVRATPLVTEGDK